MISQSPTAEELSRYGVTSPDCPYVRQPLADCYCRSLTKATIPLVIYFCRDLYVSCPIYRARHHDSEK